MIERAACGSGLGATDRDEVQAPRRIGGGAPVARTAALVTIGLGILFIAGAPMAHARPAERAVERSVHGSPAPTIAALEAARSRPAPGTRIEAIERAGDDLLAIVRHAHRGELQQRELRAARLGVERRLARSLAAMPADLRPSDRARFDRAVARLNQIIIRSQEWEAFGAQPRPEWGWDPRREIIALESDDAVLESGEVVVADVR